MFCSRGGRRGGGRPAGNSGDAVVEQNGAALAYHFRTSPAEASACPAVSVEMPVLSFSAEILSMPAAIVSDSATVHDIVTELCWRNPEIREFAHLDEAMRYLGIEGPTAIDVQSRVNEMQREVA